MKHSVKITSLLLVMYLITQFIGLAVVGTYQPEVKETVIGNQTVNVTTYNLPYGTDPPETTSPKLNLVSILIAMLTGVIVILLLMKIKAEVFFRIWFFLVIILALGISINSLFINIKHGAIISLIIALPLALIKVFQKNIIVHNLTELIIYPGIASIFVPLLSLWTVSILLILISLYDMYAVWHSGFMQKMAKYQIQKVRVFSGFFVPYIGNKERQLLEKSKGKNIAKKMKVHVAILGGGDIVFPIILAGVVLNIFGLIPAIIISLGATAALGGLFLLSEKGKFYPAMPFISTGCFIALGLVYLIF